MSKSDLRFQIDPFWETYKETLDLLREVGKKFPVKKRLPLFKLYLEISKLPPTEVTQSLLWKLDTLRELMARGLEPKVKNGKYI